MPEALDIGPQRLVEAGDGLVEEKLQHGIG